VRCVVRRACGQKQRLCDSLVINAEIVKQQRPVLLKGELRRPRPGRAPPAVVEREKARIVEWQGKLVQLREMLAEPG